MGFGIIFVNKDSFGFKIDSPKIHDNIDVMRVANEMKPCGVKNLPSIISLTLEEMQLQKQYLTILLRFARNVVKPYFKKFFFLMAN